MRIKILTACRGSNDGISVVSYSEGDVLEVGADISEDLAAVFLDEGWAEKVKVTPRKQKSLADSGE